MPHCKIHNVRFYKPETRAIYCMSLHENKNKLAVSRSDGSLEIWNIKDSIFIEKSIPSDPENFSIEGLTWCGDRIFSVGLHGLLIEYDLHSLSIKTRLAVTGVAAFCLDVNKNKNSIAIGTEQGYLNLFKIHENEVVFDTFFDKQEGRILCLKFDYTGNYIVSGGCDAIRIWNVQSGHAIHKMTLGKSEANKSTIVWCLEVTSDFTVISGDSRGKLTFWDGKIGAQVESYQSHKADILSICLNDNESELFCAGADPNISSYVKINVKTAENHKWVRSIQRKIHDHDVRSLILQENKLYSGGIDGYLVCSFHPPKTLIKIPPLLQTPCCHLAKDCRLLLLRYPKRIELWSLGFPQETDSSFRGILDLEIAPKKLLSLQKSAKNFEGENDSEGIICCEISRDGRWLAYSSKSGLKLFVINDLSESSFNIFKVTELENRNKSVVNMVFSYDCCQFVTAKSSGEICVYDLRDDQASINTSIDVKDDISDTVSFLTISNCGKYLVVGDCSSSIVIFTKQSKSWSKYSKLPKYVHGVPTCLSINSNSLTIVAVYSDYKLIEYDIKKKELTKSSRHLESALVNQLKSKYNAIRSISFDSRNDNIIILQDDSNVLVINKDKIVQNDTDDVKRVKQQTDKIKTDVDCCSVIKMQKHLVHLSSLSYDEIVAVEVNPIHLIENLPPAFVQTTFGKK